MTAENTETVQEVHYDYQVAVKFRNNSHPYTFGSDRNDFRPGDMLVVETAQGIEVGECTAKPLPTDKYPPKFPLKPVIRIADLKDKRNYEDNFIFAEEAMKICQEEVDDLGLNMHLLSASYVLDRSKVLFVYTADQRVDFRELLKRLGARLHCRIELRQIGERDQAKMIGGIGLCGMECCCSRFKTHFDNISINMAKNQQLALNIEKLSGMCGKLMCCLRYENDIYTEMTQDLPKVGAHVEYEGEMYRVTSINVIANQARLENSESYQAVTVDELREKAIIRKGVTIKRATGRRTLNRTASRQVTEKPEENKRTEISKQDPAKVQTRTFTAKKQERQDKPNNNARPEKQNRNRRQNRREAAPANKPNVTVRSFKVNREKQEGQGQQRAASEKL